MPDRRVAWLFPGQGAQEVGMAHDLHAASPAARRVFETADETLGYSISQVCFEGPAERLQDTQARVKADVHQTQEKIADIIQRRFQEHK
jgi:[acyl-carrier-protein] S-malonyltransferase